MFMNTDSVDPRILKHGTPVTTGITVVPGCRLQPYQSEAMRTIAAAIGAVAH